MRLLSNSSLPETFSGLLDTFTSRVDTQSKPDLRRKLAQDIGGLRPVDRTVRSPVLFLAGNWPPPPPPGLIGKHPEHKREKDTERERVMRGRRQLISFEEGEKKKSTAS